MPVPILNTPLKKPITDGRRELMMRAMDGNNDLIGTMHILHHYDHCDSFLTFLIANGYTGKNLADFLVNKFGGSVPRLVEYLVEAIKGAATRKRKFI